MTEIRTEILAPESGPTLLARSFEAEVTEGDGRTIDLRLVPYNVATTVADAPDFKPYRESFLPGAFAAQTRAADRLKVWLNFEHEQGLRGIVGHGVQLEDGDSDLRGSFRVHDNADGDKALELVREGILTGASIEFAALRSRVQDGIVQRLRAHLDKVSLCRFPAYADAAILGVRQQVLIDELPETHPPNFERLEALGILPPFEGAISRRPWDGSPDRFTDEQWTRSCVIDRGSGALAKDRYSLPVIEPNGDLNVYALRAASAQLRRKIKGVTPAQRQLALTRLARYQRHVTTT